MLREARLKFTRELPGTLTILSVTAEGIRINDRLWSAAIAIDSQQSITEWPQKSVADLVVEDFAALLGDSPELIVLGTGEKNLFPPRELTFAFARRGVGLEVMDTAAAARTFNVLAGDGRQVAAVLYVCL